MKPTVEVTETNFENHVLKSNQSVLVGFVTGWSLPSMTLEGVLEEIGGFLRNCKSDIHATNVTVGRGEAA